VYLILINSFVVRYTAGINDSGALLSLVVSLYGMSPTVLLAGLAALTVLTKVVDRETTPKSGARLDEQFSANGIASNRQGVKM
jgi:hypothetical protein